MNETRHYIGIDIGLTETTVCLLPEMALISISENTTDVLKRLRLYSERLSDAIQEGVPSQPVICIEKPGYHLRGNAVNLVALYWYLLDACCVRKQAVYAIPPATLKKFACGKGNAAKSKIGQAVERNWGDELPDRLLSHDEADAFVLAKIAECIDSENGEWYEYQKKSVGKAERAWPVE